MKKGFTLTELLVVVLIIGILSSAALPKYRRAVERAEMMEALTQGKTIYDSAVRYKSANGDAPTSFTQLDAILTGVNNSTGSAFQEGRFIYELHQNLVSVTKDDGSYKLDMLFPQHKDNGVFAPIYCCPSTAWVCKTAAGKDAPVVANCLELK